MTTATSSDEPTDQDKRVIRLLSKNSADPVNDPTAPVSGREYAEFVVLDGRPHEGEGRFGHRYRDWLVGKRGAGLVEWDNNRERHVPVWAKLDPLSTAQPTEPPAEHQRQPETEPPADQPESELPATRQPKHQNEHLWTLKRDSRFTPAEKWVGTIAALLSYAENEGYGDRDLAPEYLAKHTGVTERKARDTMAKLVRLGYFQRLDNGKGGGRRNRAKYVPTVPEGGTQDR
jgi:hypothetical protein